MKVCEKCGKEHDGSYGSGRFCCSTCARTYANTFVSDEGRANQIKALTNKENIKKSIDTRNSPEYKLERSKNRQKEMTKEKRYTDISSKKIGTLGELETMKKFSQRGIPVYVALTDDSGTDMIAEFGGKLQKIQVKTTQIQKSRDENDMGSIRFELSRNIYDNGKILKEKYTNENVDYFSLYDANNDNLFLLKNENINAGGHISLRYSKPKSINQYKSYNAYDYDFDRVLDNIENNIDHDDIIDI